VRTGPIFGSRTARLARYTVGVEDAPTFERAFEVVDADIDELGHASNIAYVRWIQDVAVAHSAEVGLDLSTYQRIGAIFVVVRHEIDYLRPALRGDKLKARTWISSVMAAKCLRETEITREQDGILLAKSITTWGFIEVATGRPRRISDFVRSAFYPPTEAAT
jgi:acyl-CoA thioester hydrolase